MQRQLWIALFTVLGGVSHAQAETGVLTVNTSFGSVSAALMSGATAVPATSWYMLLAAALLIVLATRKQLLRLRSTAPLALAALIATIVAATHWYGDVQAAGALNLPPPQLFTADGAQQTLQLGNLTGQPVSIQDIRVQGRFTQTNGCSGTLYSGAHCPITVAYRPGICQTCTSDTCINGACQGPTCTDGQRNGTETDVDCGGICGACGTGKVCAASADCQSGVCSAGICQPATCTDSIKNGSETDTDCGGICGACSTGKVCAASAECQSGVCSAGICQPATCTDSIKNGSETDTDCGGICGACGTGKACLASTDCLSGTCNAGVCQ